MKIATVEVMMPSWIIAPSGLIEPVPAPEIYVTGIGAIESVGTGDLRVVLVQEQLPLESGGHVPQRVVVAKLVGPTMNVPTIIGQLAQCLWRPTLHIPEGSRPRLVE